jgi:hypothetical protein
VQAIQHFTTLIKTDQVEITVTHLTKMTKASLASAALPCRDDTDFGLLATDTPLALSLYECAAIR